MRYTFLRFPNGKAKALTFSYDDGSKQDVRLAQLLTKYGLKCTFNLNGQKFKGNDGLTVEQVKEHILAKGHEIAVHGYCHRGEGYLRPIEGIVDVLDNRRELESTYGRIVRGMAYPDCGITAWAPNNSYDKVKNYLCELDIVYARTIGQDNDCFSLPTDWHAWMPSAHHGNPKIMEYIDKFLSRDLSKGYCSSRAPWLLYIWGHSSEFERENNWAHAEEICKRLSDNDDIWYATNIEIYDYVRAYNSLVYSADNSMVYNPNLTTVWLDRDGVIYSIKSGELLHF